MKTLSAVLCFVLVVLTLSSTTLFAQDSSKVHSLEKGAWALAFQLYGSLLDARMLDFDGKTFSGKYHPSDKRAWRIGAEVRANVSDNKGTINDILDDEIDISKASSSVLEIQLTAQHLWYVRSNKNIHFFFGIGPEFSFYNSKSTNSSDKTNPSEDNFWKSESKSARHSIGVTSSLGVEFFIKSNLSFLAEYNTSARYSMSSSNSTTEQESPTYDSETEGSGISLYPANIKMGLSFYF